MKVKPSSLFLFSASRIHGSKLKSNSQTRNIGCNQTLFEFHLSTFSIKRPHGFSIQDIFFPTVENFLLWKK